MPVTNQLPSPVVRCHGYFNNVYSGLSSIQGGKRGFQPENTLIVPGGLRGTFDYSSEEALYCISDGTEDDVIISIYDQISKRGGIFYIKESVQGKGGQCSELESFISLLQNIDIKRIFVTITGGATLSRNSLVKSAQTQLKKLKVIKTTWNNYLWIPNKWRYCCHHCWIVKLDLSNGAVKSFRTSYVAVNSFMNNDDFLRISRTLRVVGRDDFIAKFFRNHPEFREMRGRIEAIAQKKPFGNITQFIQPIENSNVFVFVSCPIPTNGVVVDMIGLKNALRSGCAEYVILYPSNPHPLPVIPDTQPVSFPTEVASRSIITQRRKKGQATSADHPPAVAREGKSATRYTVIDDPYFRGQLALLQTFGNDGVYKSTLNKISEIRQDAENGRIPGKIIEGYRICDLSGLGANGRGNWRLLMTLSGGTVTFKSIADYHGNRWRTWC
ncbi:hypothetical protein MUU47_22005 [Scandinavium sp. H11S7]|uniref:Uncharacterized protein n=1 Tax=Scandinavium hiltneri TaxID=2926519 RepID=A0ABT2E7V4_9ENTR|nr:hypothetical protein [Scandinavium hiltneri]MCS2163751.1 hypothetical protein [Scandinavium hiltneri]